MTERDERSIRSVLRDIGADIDRIVRAELRFAVAEFRVGLHTASDASRMLIAGVICALLAATFFLLGIMFALGLVMPLWLSALLIALLVGTAAALLLTAGRARLSAGRAAASPTLTPVSG